LPVLARVLLFLMAQPVGMIEPLKPSVKDWAWAAVDTPASATRAAITTVFFIIAVIDKPHVESVVQTGATQDRINQALSRLSDLDS
jgi:hypothetical protein